MDPNQGAQHPIRPTLFLGLGGTGKEVLLRLRRRFYERFRETGLPCIGYLWIDTDTRDVGARGEKLDEAFAAVGFREAERIGLLQGNVRQSASDIFHNRERWAFIHAWLYDEVERYGQEISDGAGGVRAVGRLTFFNNYQSLSQRISQELTRLATQQSLQATQDFFRTHGLGQASIVADPNPFVFVVASVAGGTGCGIYLDTGFLLNYLATRGVSQDKLFAYLFLPNVFYNTNKAGELAERSYGNAYASLKELDFYAKRLPLQDHAGRADLGIDYVVEWEQGKRLRVQGPPFSAVYLLEMKNEAGVALGHQNRNDIFSMLAECLFLDLLPGPFSNGKRSDYSNITLGLAGAAGSNVTHQGVSLPQSFARRYATCGLSKIEIPVDSIRGACAAKLAVDIVGHILRDRADVNVKNDVRSDLASYRLDKDGIPDRFGSTWKETIRREVGVVFRNRSITEEKQVQELEEDLRKIEDRLVRSDSTDKTKLGDIIRHLDGKAGAVAEDIRQGFVELLRVTCLEDDGRGLRATLADGGYLQQAIANTKGLYAPLEEGAKAEFQLRRDQSEQDAQAYASQKQHQLQELQSALRSPVLSLLATKRWTLSKVLERLREAEEQYLLAKAEVCLFDGSKRVARSLVDYMGEQRRLLDAFQQSVTSLSNTLKQRYLGFLSSESHVLFIRLFDRDRDEPQFYKLDKDEDSGQLREIIPVREYKGLLAQEVRANAGLLDLAEVFEREGLGEVEKRLTSYCENRFWHDFTANPRLVRVTDHPLWKERRQELIQRLVNSARPMLRQKPKMGAASVEAPRFAYLGIADPDSEPYRSITAQIDELVRSIPGCNYQLQPQPTQNPSEIYLYFSNYAYALPALPIVSDECHEAYNDFYSRLDETAKGLGQIPLHLSRRWEGSFDDLLVYTDEEAKTLAEIYSILIFGTILKVLTLRQDKGQLVFQYRRGMPYRDSIRLGTRRNAVAKLRQDAVTRQMLLLAIKQREATLTDDLVLSYYWALQGRLNAADVLPETPEAELLSRKLVDVHERSKMIVDPAALEPPPDKDKRLEHVKSHPTFGLEWPTETLPSLKNLEVWEKPSATTAAL